MLGYPKKELCRLNWVFLYMFINLFQSNFVIITKLFVFDENLPLAPQQRPRGVSVTVCVPPDTDTPGFETENLGKPEECRILSESAGLFSVSC